jgi:unsaturated rhamnogalacturonyl hydrolase
VLAAFNLKKLMRKLIYSLLGVALFASCQSKTSLPPVAKWSVRMAEAVMHRADTLTKYLGATESKGWQYDVAMLGMAIDKLGDIDPKYSTYMTDYVNVFVDDSGHIAKYVLDEYNIDRINPGRNLITLYKRSGDKKYQLAFEQLVKQMETHPRTKEGGYWHKKIYPNQMWLDGIYMASPFLAQYASEFNQPKWFDEVAFQITTIYKRTYDEKTGLLFHAYDESRQMPWSNPETGHSPHFWSRSIGWYAMAIVDVLDYLPQQHPSRDSIITILQKTCDALLKVRDPKTGLWFQVLDQGNRQGNYIEGSGSAMYTYAFAKGAKKGYLDSKYLELANQSFDAIIKELITYDEQGYPVMHSICGGCGLGGNPYRDGSFEYYVNEKVVDNDTKGVAPFILAAIELDR